MKDNKNNKSKNNSIEKLNKEKENSRKSNLTFGVISILIPIAAEFYFGNSPYMESTTAMSILWMFVNYMFLTTTYQLIVHYTPIMTLKGLTMRKTRLNLNLLTYYAAIVFFNAYFLYNLYTRDNVIISRLANPILMVLVLLTFFINLYSGIFPKITKKDNVTLYDVNEKLPFRNGREKVDVLAGIYEGGLVVGINKFRFSTINNIFEDKDTLVIRGKDEEGAYRVNISAPKTKYMMKNYIKAAEELNLLTRDVINISYEDL